MIVPDYYKNFKCTASECGDTCCAAWEVDIDDDTADFYSTLGGEIGERLKHAIKTNEDGAYFALTEQGRCPFLNSDNLCDIIIDKGEGAICDICTEHPRFYRWVGGRLEAGLGLCCEEAGRLIFSHNEPLRFVHSDETEDEETELNECENIIIEARSAAYEIAQDRSLSIPKRIEKLLDFGNSIQRKLDLPVEKAAFTLNSRERYDKIFDIIGRLEVLDSAWSERICCLRGSICRIIENIDNIDSENEYEQLLMYFLYRYMSAALDDGDIVSKLRFAAAGYMVIHALDIQTRLEKGKLDLSDRIFNAKQWSKEIEYSDENVTALFAAL